MAHRSWSNGAKERRSERPKQMARHQPHGRLLKDTQHSTQRPTLHITQETRYQDSVWSNTWSWMRRRIFRTQDTTTSERKQHNLESFVIFVDLVKAYDTVNHDLLIDVLERYGTPPKMRSAIKRMYTDLKVKISVEDKTAEISQTVGVRQGDNMLPVLFLFFMSAFWRTA